MSHLPESLLLASMLVACLAAGTGAVGAERLSVAAILASGALLCAASLLAPPRGPRAR